MHVLCASGFVKLSTDSVSISRSQELGWNGEALEVNLKTSLETVLEHDTLPVHYRYIAYC